MSCSTSDRFSRHCPRMFIRDSRASPTQTSRCWKRELAPLRSFVLPGGSRIDAELHIARTVCRRAERACVALGRVESVPPETVRYLNRLSDALFVWARWTAHASGAAETLWEPNQS